MGFASKRSKEKDSLYAGYKANSINPHKVTEIPLSSILVAPQPRTVFHAIDDLSLSIKKYGLSNPIIVMEHESDPNKVYLQEGERRFRAFQKNNMACIPCKITPFNADKKLLWKRQVNENTEREDLLAIEIAEGIHHCLNVLNFSKEEVLSLYKIKGRMLRYYLQIAGLDEETKKVCGERKLSLRQILSSFTKKSTTSKQYTTAQSKLRRTKDGITLSKIKITIEGKNKTTKNELKSIKKELYELIKVIDSSL
jgi:ParB/RepB/Spo0J family partition protein